MDIALQTMINEKAVEREQIRIILAKSSNDLIIIEKLAHEIWHEHYTPIIGKNQVEYMIEKFQSTQNMSDQIDEGYEYYLVTNNDEPCGYLSIQVRENSLFLSKLYLLKSYRGSGIGKVMLGKVINRATESDQKCIELTVNKYNSDTIKAYKKMDFKIVKEAVFDIGGGYVMDDYVMTKEL
ncbi:GNAT family N-acetyltransferase [Aureibacter tunicatorum]|uniref:Ribosomal protein S18 acetylase RimI-like enzyme n=1 Tax=Aureibacter tunicatorum TaxID=866807 RepID=A0AAE3XRB4_9BACT|nr:GNAT family N-acetyltransferase [Aureibacter tunicatorum]MDR6240466.1 ribosomal protein S18 acetylase RimI-like enzyme [Aureibacter tunicatorum]BDD05655.1 N-acetyltransferase [Aureibacter tunicatorum]